jgi:DNA replication protein DnaC
MKKAIEQMCKDLRIGNIVSQNYQDIEADSYEEFLYKVLKSVVEDREINRKNRLLKQANFPVLKTFENYSFEKIQIPKKYLSIISSKVNLYKGMKTLFFMAE